MKIHTEWSTSYLNQQISAMRWLKQQGLTSEEIRLFRWGLVDETDKTITIRKKLFSVQYDVKTGIVNRIENEKQVKVEIDRGQEQFFLKSKYICPWMFTKTPPKTWRKEGSKESLFPLMDVENFTRDIPLKNSTNILTFMGMFDTIDISKLNVTKLKPTELIEEAEVIKNWGE